MDAGEMLDCYGKAPSWMLKSVEWESQHERKGLKHVFKVTETERNMTHTSASMSVSPLFRLIFQNSNIADSEKYGISKKNDKSGNSRFTDIK